MSIHERLTDDALVASLTETALAGRRNLADLLALLIEVEDRRLHLARGHSSLFGFCCEVLRFSEGEAGNRVAAVHAARRFPMILDLLRDGEINLTTVRLLAPHLTPDNHLAVLESARGKGRVQVEQIVVSLAPRPVIAPTLRSITPAPVSVLPVATPLRPQPVVTPLAPELYRLSVPMTTETRELWNRLRELVPGDDAIVLAHAVAVAVRVLEQQKNAATVRPVVAPRETAPHSRHVPAAVRRSVAARDHGQCAFVGTTGRRCTERRFLEFHHVRPWMAGGPTTVENVQLRCRAHNQHEADVFYGTSRNSLVPDQPRA